jgi:endoglucanase
VGWALTAGLQAIINVHHYDELATAPEAHLPRLLSLWRQIAAHYARAPESVIFEVLNEPNSALSPALWNAMQPQLVAAIRESSPTRTIIVGGGMWNSLDGLQMIDLPDDDHLLATFHFYEPYPFTHQGAEWAVGMNLFLGMTWGERHQVALVAERLQLAAEWSAAHGVPVLLGEFGVYDRADMDSRLRWTTFVRETVESLNIGWCYWDFAAGFGIFETESRQFNELYRALIPE